MSEKLMFTPEQQRAIDSRGGALLVSAAAGSGKTKVLVERLLGRVMDDENGCDVDDFLVITYTKAAASELRAKILDGISERLAENPMSRKLRRQQIICHRAEIGTIHSFCARIIRDNVHILNISPDFRVADEAESMSIKLKVLDDVLEARYTVIAENAAFAQLVDTMGAGRDDRKLIEIVLDTYSKLQSHPYPQQWINAQTAELSLDGVTDAAETIWGKALVARAKQAADYWIGRMRSLIEEAGTYAEFYAKYEQSLSDTLDTVLKFSDALSESWDAAHICAAQDFPKATGRASGYDDLKAARKKCVDEMRKIFSWFETSSAESLEDIRAVAPIVGELLQLTRDFDTAYAAEKNRRNVIDFSDQEHMAVRLLVDEETMQPTPLAREISARYEEIMVDEYQDVNAVQELIFAAISKDGKNLFMVGDVKQSIYRFRLADPSIFLSKYRSFKDDDKASDGEERRVVLSRNFRSRAGILSAVNYIFRNIMSTDFGEMEYTPREYLYPGANYPETDEAEVELNVIDLSYDGDEGDRPEKLDVEAAFIAERAQELIENGKVSDGKGGFRPVRYGDIAILLRSTKEKAARYAAALNARGIPSGLDKGEGFFESLEVSCIISLLTVIDNPLQDIPLISVLRSPLFAFTADELSDIRLQDKSADFYRALELAAEDIEKCYQFTQRLESYRNLASDMSAHELIWHIYCDTDMLSIYGAMHGGELRRSNLMEFMQLAVNYEKAGYRGLFGFITFVRKMIEQGSSPERTASGSGDAVQIMSIHKSKGLEYPIVILADTAKKFNLTDSTKPLPMHTKLGAGAKRRDLDRKIEYPTVARYAVSEEITRETLAEELRVLYVALTRAKEKLIITATIKDAEKALGKLAEDITFPVSPQRMKSLRSMSDWILVTAIQRQEAIALRFGNVPTAIDTDPGKPWDIRLVSAAGYSERTYAPSAEAEKAESVSADAETVERVKRLLEFEYPHKAALSLPSKLTATELKGRFVDYEMNEDAARMPLSEREFELRRPSFAAEKKELTAAEKGTALHIAMQYVRFENCQTEGTTSVELQSLFVRKLLTTQQLNAIDPAKITKFATSDVCRKLLSADKLYREFKFSVLVSASELYPNAGEDKILLQGVVDCAAESGEELIILDFKTDYVTDSSIAAKAEYYRGQLEAYKLAMSRITGKENVRTSLYFFALNREIEV